MNNIKSSNDPYREAKHQLRTTFASFQLGLDLLMKPEMKHDRKVICDQMDKNVETLLKNWKIVRCELSHE